MNESKRSIRLLALLAATLLTMATVFFAGSATNAWAEDPAAPAPAGNHIAAVQFSLIGYAFGQTPTSVQVGSQTDKVNVESKKFFSLTRMQLLGQRPPVPLPTILNIALKSLSARKLVTILTA